MKLNFFLSNTFISLILICGMEQNLSGQQYDCTFKEPLLKIDFGEGKTSPVINSSYLPKYQQVSHSCPIDGHYSYVSSTSDCFGGDWFTLYEDHTPNDNDGNMMLVNASETGGIFFTDTINGLAANATYEFAAWMMNICKLRGGCAPLPPSITILITSPSGRKVGLYEIGQLVQREEPLWKKYVGFFNTGANETMLFLTLQDNTIGGCGNDFALDDITISECRKPQPVVIDKPKPIPEPVIKKVMPTPKPEAKKAIAVIPPIKNYPRTRSIEKTVTDTSINIRPSVKYKPGIMIPLPAILQSRFNPLIKLIETDAGELKIDLYDNGEIDGDTVSIYHNNELIISRAALSEKPVTLHISIDGSHPHHELVMVANNLGSIPPNTSLMIITVNNRRYEVFISSSEQKNAKVVIDLKE